jgi:FkbM family methyltransferase
MEWFSQHKQDEFVANYFNKKKNGVFFEAGALDGLEASNTLALERFFDWSGILVEPFSEQYKKVVINRPGCRSFNCALYNRDGFVTFQKNYGYGLNLSGIPETYHPRHAAWIDSSDTVKKLVTTSCRTVNSILSFTGISRVDYMSLDTEGSEFQILEAIDFKLFDIELLTVEVSDYIEYENKIVTLMNTRGYEVIERLGKDIVLRKKV